MKRTQYYVTIKYKIYLLDINLPGWHTMLPLICDTVHPCNWRRVQWQLSQEMLHWVHKDCSDRDNWEMYHPYGETMQATTIWRGIYVILKVKHKMICLHQFTLVVHWCDCVKPQNSKLGYPQEIIMKTDNAFIVHILSRTIRYIFSLIFTTDQISD